MRERQNLFIFRVFLIQILQEKLSQKENFDSEKIFKNFEKTKTKNK